MFWPSAMAPADPGVPQAALNARERRRLFLRVKELTRVGRHAEAYSLWMRLNDPVPSDFDKAA
ncbi:MAG: hypothetical protein VKK98_09765 [Cyanobacteriota bacterium]|nr:hypothetical protein [Cyanobacteriota bacterium]